MGRFRPSATLPTSRQADANEDKSLKFTGMIDHGDWKLARKLGEGSFGQVFAAVNYQTGSQFAIKSIWISGKEGEKALMNTMQDTILLTKLDHPHIVKYLGCHMDDHYFYMYMELVSGGSLDGMMYESVADSAKLSLPLVRNYARQCLEGLLYLHRNGVVHRDLKPGNVLVTVEGKLKLADFGCSYDLTQLCQATKQTTVGPPAYMAPEVVTKDHHTTASDIWSFGAMFFEMITGELYFGDKSPNALFMELAMGTINISWPQWQIHPEAKNVIKWCLNTTPTLRPSAKECADHVFFSRNLEHLGFKPPGKEEFTKTPGALEHLQKPAEGESPSPSPRPSPNLSGDGPLYGKHKGLNTTDLLRDFSCVDDHKGVDQALELTELDLENPPMDNLYDDQESPLASDPVGAAPDAAPTAAAPDVVLDVAALSPDVEPSELEMLKAKADDALLESTDDADASNEVKPTVKFLDAQELAQQADLEKALLRSITDT